VPTSFRERLSARLLRTGVELGADRERLARSIRDAAPDERAYQQAAGPLLLAEAVDTLLVWLSARLRARSSLRQTSP
jgi:hypothetical protein